MNLVYWLFRHKGRTPDEYWAMSEGAKALVAAFVSREIETGG